MTNITAGLNSKVSSKASEIWALADILRGTLKPTEYGKVILPFLTLKRLDDSLQGTKQEVLNTHEKFAPLTSGNPALYEKYMQNASGYRFYNTSQYDFPTLLASPTHLEANLLNYFNGYSIDVQDIIQSFNLENTVRVLSSNSILFAIVEKVNTINLHPNVISNIEMGYVLEEVLRRFSEMTNETAGEHYTPRSVVKLATHLAIEEDPQLLNRTNQIIRIYDPACGTGGMLTAGEETVQEFFTRMDNKNNPMVELYGQELNAESYAIAKADMLIKGEDPSRIKNDNTLTADQFPEMFFTYSLANPPYGVSWKQYEAPVLAEAKQLGYSGRFGAGLPSVSDGQLLFVQHILSKLDTETGGRAAVVLNGSPLTNGDAGSGESNIRKWILENDYLSAIVALPTDMFYNTGIKTYIWVLDNRKPAARRGRVQFIDASGQFFKMKKALGSKRNDMSMENIAWVTEMYEQFEAADPEYSKVVQIEELMYRKVIVDVPQLDENGNVVKDKKGKVVVDKSQRDTEKIPFLEDVNEYMQREVLPHVPNAIWEKEGKVGAEFPLDQYFYKYEPLPSTEELKKELEESITRIQALMGEVFGA